MTTPTEYLLKSLFVMAAMVEARDPYTGGHLWRVSQFCRLLAEQGNMPPSQVARTSLGGFLHDLGKIGVPDAILNKPGRLNSEEYDIIMTHPEVGHRLLADHPLAELVRSAVLSHHEHPDGRGYPQQLSNDQISLEAKIVAVCDAFDAMTSTRSYRTGMAITQALEIIQENLDRQFDREWGERFIHLGTDSFGHIVGHSEPGIPLQSCPICGPTIVIKKHHQDGAPVYCRVCGSEFIVHRHEEKFSIEPTMRHGTPASLRPDVDVDLIGELVRESTLLLESQTTPISHQ